jgi:DNA-directed RNA polymerase specialized sigma24 family protein
MTTWHFILPTLYADLAAHARRLAAQQAYSRGDRHVLAEEALQDACKFLLKSTRTTDHITDCRAYAITTVSNAMLRIAMRERMVRKVYLEDTNLQTLASPSSPSDAMEATETLAVARKAVGERLWRPMESLLDNPAVSAGEDAQRLGTTPATIRVMRHEARRRIAQALRSKSA